MPRLRSPLLALAIVLAAVLGTVAGLQPAGDPGAFTAGPSLDAFERSYDGTAIRTSRTAERTATHRLLWAPPTRGHRDGATERHVRIAAPPAPRRATHAEHLLLLTHQRNDLDA